MTARWIGFINSQKPDAKGYSKWPTYTNKDKKLLHFGEESSEVIKDDYREEEMNYFQTLANDLK